LGWIEGGSRDSDFRFFGNKIGMSAFVLGVPVGSGAMDVMGDGIVVVDVAGGSADGRNGGRLEGDRWEGM
jgi:hypothetical protein